MKRFFAIVTIAIIVFPQLVSAQGETVTRAFGANIHLVQRYDSSLWADIATQAATDGVSVAREEFNWNVIEPSDNSFNFTEYDTAVQTYTDVGIDVVGLLTYSSDWAATGEFDEPSTTAWEDYVSTVADRYSGEITYWEIWNEPNYSAFWTGSVTDYAHLIETAATAITEANPDAKIVLGGLSGSDSDWLDDLYNELSDPSIIDVVAVHPYRVIGSDYSYSPEISSDGLNSLTTDLGTILGVMNRHGETDTPIWLTEVGWPTDDTGVDEATQANYLTRLYALAFSVPRVEKVLWYNWSDDTSDFGLYNSDLTSKTAASAFSFMSTYLAGSHFTQQTLVHSTASNLFGNSNWAFSGTQCTDGTISERNNVLTATYHFTADTNCYAPITINKKLPKHTKTIQFQAKGSDDDTILRVRITDNTGETFQYNLSYVPSNWLYYTLKLKQYSNHWGGDNDGVLDGRLTFNSLIVDDTDGSRANASMQFKDLQTSTAQPTYLLKFKRSSGNRYLFWTTGRVRQRTITISNHQTQLLQFDAAATDESSSTGKYRLEMGNSVRIITPR